MKRLVNRFFIFCFFAIPLATFILGLLISAIITPTYTAEAVVGPKIGATQNEPLSGIGAFRPLGLSLDVGQVDEFDLFMNALTAPGTLVQIDQTDLVYRALFETEWDATKESWNRPTGVAANVKFALYSLIGVNSWAPPGPERLRERLQAVVSIDEGSEEPLTVIRVRFPERTVSLYLLETLLAKADQRVRQEAKDDLLAQRRYLNTRLDEIAEKTVREGVLNLLVSTEYELMLAESGTPYAAKVYVQPHALPYPSSPRLVPILTIFVLLGLSAGTALFLHRLRDHRQQKPASDEQTADG